MQQFLRYQRVIMIICLLVALVVGAGIFLVKPSGWTYATGWLWGVFGGLVTLRLKVLALVRFAENPDNPPVKSGFQGYIVMILFLAAGWVANKYNPYNHDVVNIWMVFAGTFLPNIVLMADGLLRPQRHVGQAEEDAGEV